MQNRQYRMINEFNTRQTEKKWKVVGTTERSFKFTQSKRNRS